MYILIYNIHIYTYLCILFMDDEQAEKRTYFTTRNIHTRLNISYQHETTKATK